MTISWFSCASVFTGVILDEELPLLLLLLFPVIDFNNICMASSVELFDSIFIIGKVVLIKFDMEPPDVTPEVVIGTKPDKPGICSIGMLVFKFAPFRLKTWLLLPFNKLLQVVFNKFDLF